MHDNYEPPIEDKHRYQSSSLRHSQLHIVKQNIKTKSYSLPLLITLIKIRQTTLVATSNNNKTWPTATNNKK